METSWVWTTLAARYSCKSSDLARLREGLLKNLAPLAGEHPRSSGAVTVIAPEGDMELTTAYATALECLDALSPAAVAWWTSFECDGTSVRLNAQMGEVQVSLAGWQTRLADFKLALNEFTTVSGLSRAVSRPESMRGERRSYYTEKTITREWFQDCLAILAQYEGTSSRFTGQIIGKGPEYNDNNLENWIKEVELQWDDLKMITYWRMDNRASQWICIDFNAQGTILALWSTPEMAAQKGLRFEDFVTPLHLFAADGDPNQGYRFGRTYRKKDRSWKEEDDWRVATAIEASIKAAFGEERVVVQSAGFIEGGFAERQVNFSDVDSFLVRLRNDAPYQSADLILRGPRGNYLEFVLKPKACTVVVKGIIMVSGSKDTQRSTLIDKQLNAFTEPFRNKDLGLELIDSEDPAKPEDAPSKTAKAAVLTPWIPVVTAVAAGVVAFLLGSNGLQSLKPTLDITVPLSAASGKVAVTGNELPVRWTVTSKRLFHGEETKDIPATILVQQQGPPYHAHEYTGQESGKQLLNFEGPGIYDVTVRVQADGSPHERTFEATVAP